MKKKEKEKALDPEAEHAKDEQKGVEENPGNFENPEGLNLPGKMGNLEKVGNHGNPENHESRDNSDNSGNPENSESIDNSDSSEGSGNSGSTDSSESTDRSESTDTFSAGDGGAPQAVDREKMLSERISASEESEADREEAQNLLHDIFAASDGGGDDDLVEMLMRAVKFDREVEAARLSGEIAGRNARIEAEMLLPDDGDGLPPLDSGMVSLREGRRGGSIFDLAGYAR